MKIAQKVTLLAPGLVVATAALVGLVMAWGYDRLVAAQQRAHLQRLAAIEARRLESALDELRHDVTLLQAMPATRALMRSADPVDGRLSDAQLRRVLADVFVAMASAKPLYSQLRLIGAADGGRELVRVDRRDGAVRVVAEDALQRKGHRPYFTESIGLPEGALYVSRIDLNREHGAIEVPHRPMLRVLRTLRDAAGRPAGVVAINLDFAAFARGLYPPDDDRYSYHLADADGEFLLHPDPGRSFAFDRGASDRAHATWPALAPLFAGDDAPAEGVAGAPGMMVAARRVALRADVGPGPLYLVVGASSEAIEAGEADIVARVLVVTGPLLLLSVLAGVLLSKVIVRPLRRLTAAADEIAGEGPTPTLPVGRRDEIGVLARAFQHMVAVLADKEAGLQRANVDLRDFARVAAHDLREPARRMATLADLLRVEEGERLSAEGRALLDRLDGVADDMLRRVSGLRTLSGIGEGPPPARAPVVLDDVVDGVLAEHAAPLAARPVEVRRDALPTVSAHRELVALLYRHLVANALQHAAPGPMTLRFTAARDGDGWVLGVHNTGSTLPADRLDRVFAPFARLDGASGAGLGLSICRRVAERHGGWIRAEAGPDGVHIVFSLGATADV